MSTVLLVTLALLLFAAELRSRTQLRRWHAPLGWRRPGYDLLTLLLLGLALLLPTRQAPQPRLNDPPQLAIVIDVSGSMAASDNGATRLELAIATAERWLDQLPGARWCLIPFAGAPVLQVPLTDDRDAVRFFLRQLTPGMIAAPGSDPEAALALADRTLQGERRSVLLLSDGERTLPGPAAAAPQGLPVFGYCLGAAGGAPLPRTDGGWRTTPAGELLLSIPQPQRLQQLAEQSGGKLLNSVDALDPRALLGYRNQQQLSAGATTNLPRLLGLGILLLLLLRQGLCRPRALATPLWLAASVGLLFACHGSTASPEPSLAQLFSDARQAEQPETRQVLLEQLLRQAETLGPAAQALASYNAGTLLLQQQQATEAIPLLEQALELQPADRDASINLALALRQAGARLPGTASGHQQETPPQPGKNGSFTALQRRTSGVTVHPLANRLAQQPQRPPVKIERDW